MNVKKESVLLECEQFDNLGGWKIDSQFRFEMGSTYVIAHGLGIPVADAVTTFEIKVPGEYFVFARTMNWTAKWTTNGAAGMFRIFVDGTELPTVFGTGNADWQWHNGGKITLSAGNHTVTLHDLTGFDGRCDAIYITSDPDNLPDTSFENRNNQTPLQTVEADITVVGAGIAGICTAITAARLGLKVSLIHDRPVLGGANSSEVRVHLGGFMNLGEYPRLGDTVAEIGPPTGGNAQPADNYCDKRKLEAVKAEKNITLFLNTMADDVLMSANGKIKSVTGTNVINGQRIIFSSPLFADCTGDATVGALAGADFRLGRESKAETGEDMATDVADNMTLGASVQWYAKKGGNASFPNEPWMIDFNEQNCEYNMRGDWDWETGMLRDQLHDFETVRDYGLLVVYSNWSYIKNKGTRKNEFADAELEWVAYIAGKRETRRLLGDHILCQQDVFEEKPYPDGTCCTTWAIDLHFPMPSNQRNYPGEPFRSICTHNTHYAYPIPYRCLYSRNIGNLFMAGRNISVTHVALGTTRVMRTHGMQGEVIGMAASICAKYDCSPRDIYTGHLDELKSLMKKGIGLGKPQPAQNYNCGAMKIRN